MLAQKNEDILFKADFAYSEGNFTEASNLYSELIREKELNVYVKKKAISDYNRENYKQALEGFEFLAKRELTYASINMAKCYARLNDFDNALKYLEIHLRRKAKQTKASLKLEPAFTELKKTKVWEKLWLNDWYSDEENQIGDAIYNYNHQNYIDALDILDGLILKNEKNDEAYYLRAKTLAAIENYKNAFKDIKQAFGLNRKNEDYILLYAEIAEKLKKYEEALEKYNLLLKQNKYDLKNYEKRAKIYSALDQPEEAIKDIDLCLKYNSESENLKFLKSKYQIEAGETWDALISLNKLIKKTAKPQYLIERGKLFLITNNQESAFNDFSQALDYNPNLGEAYFYIGKIHLSRNSDKNACFYLKKACEHNIYEAFELYERNCSD